MQITNKHNIPEAMYNVLSQGSHKPVAGRYSVTDLVGAPLVRILKMQKWDEIEQDVGDMMWLLLGKSVHYILEGGAPKEGIAEEKFVMPYGAVTLVGIADLWHNQILDDYKVTSVYSFILGDKPEWERQLNIYSFMYRMSNFQVTGLRINAILRDWMKSKSLQEPDYPPIPFMTVDILLWDMNYTKLYIEDRIRLHSLAEDAKDAPMCTAEERWERPTQYAVMKKGNKRADRVFDTSEAAYRHQGLKAKGEYEVVERPGESIRCRDYCIVREVCPFNPYKQEKV